MGRVDYEAIVGTNITNDESNSELVATGTAAQLIATKFADIRVVDVNTYGDEGDVLGIGLIVSIPEQRAVEFTEAVTSIAAVETVERVPIVHEEE